ncbi:hypothetical protein N2152v2_010022 [Parachlorella kessleri]
MHKRVKRTVLPSAKTNAAGSDTQAIVLEVGGMKCGGCSAAVRRILQQQPGVAAAAVNLLTETAVVQVPAGAQQAEQDSVAQRAAEALTAKGFPARLRPSDVGLQQDAAALAQRKQEELQGSQFNLAFAWTLALACGFHHVGHLLHSLGLHQYAHTEIMHGLGAAWVGGALGAASLLGPGRELLREGALALARGAPNMNSLIAVGATTSFGAGALSALLPGFSLDPSFLEEPIMLLAFVLLGRTLEARARMKASADLTSLAHLIPSQTRLVLDPTGAAGAKPAAPAEEVLVATQSVRSGDVVRVLPGERVPVDGIVVDGLGSVDESMLTGESRLVPVTSGDAVTGGTVLYEAPLTLKATSTGSSSTLAGIGRLVAEAQSREAPVQRLADWVAGKFCYTVMAASAATFTFWSTLGSTWFPDALDAVSASADDNAPLLLGVKLAIDVLVVACPCALGLATPTAVLVASSAGAKRGLLLRGGDVLERLAQVDTVVLDKTGTLTQGKLQLVGVRGAEEHGITPGELLRMAAAAEIATRHPLANAVLAAAKAQGIEVPSPSSSVTVPGEGVRAVVDGLDVAVGRREWVEQQVGDAAPAAAAGNAAGRAQQGGPSLAQHATIAAAGASTWELSSDKSGSTDGSSSGGTGSPGAAESEVWVGWSGVGLAGRLAFSDSLRPDAKAVVSALQSQGVRVLLVSGDRPEVVSAVAAQAGIAPKDALGGVRPEGKAAFVSELRQRQGRMVAMVGDGVNDAPALAAADVGCAMGGGADAAGEAAAVVLLGDRLGQVVEALALGRAAMHKIRQNLGWALGYNAVGIPLAAGAALPTLGFALDPSAAAGMMALSSVAVVSNSLLLRSAAERLPGVPEVLQATTAAAAARGIGERAGQQLGSATGPAA